MDEEYMREALIEARKAYELGEIPVGAVVVKDGTIIGRGHNSRQRDQQVSSHAEMTAISQACAFLNSWRLDDCTIYVTLEPCPMCAGTIMQARISHVYFAAEDPKAGALGSVFDLSVVQGFSSYPIRKTEGMMKRNINRLKKPADSKNSSRQIFLSVYL